MIKKILLAALVILIGIVAILLFNVLNFGSKQPPVETIDKREVNEKATGNYSRALQIKTVSPEDPADFDSTQFNLFNAFLAETYPLTDSILEKKLFNQFSHLYKWNGSNPALNPTLFMGHIDVVPVMEENIEDWDVDPFGGEVKDGIIWGRGAIDDKISVVGLMEAVELLLSEGYKPKRTIYLAFGHDEEIGGVNGAQVMSKYLEDQGVILDFVMDEGGAIATGIVDGIAAPVAVVGIAEKGFLTVELGIKIEGGHSSMPGPETAIDVLSEAVVKLKRNPFPARLSEPVKQTLRYLGPEMSFTRKLAIANMYFLESVILSGFEASPSGNALIRTTTSPTIFNSGVKDNIIPQYASAKINFRILPGETGETVTNRVKEVIDDDRIELSAPQDFTALPSAVSDVNSKGFETIHRTIKEIFPGVIVAPNLVVGGTDSRYYRNLTLNIFRFNPMTLNQENIKTFHGLNERLPIAELENAIRFYVRLIENSAQ